MKKLYLLMTAAFISISMSATNFVSNGTFETDTDGWYQIENDGTNSFVLDGLNPLMGVNSACITILTSTSTGLIDDSWKQGLKWRMSTIKNARYKVHFKARASKELQLVSMFQQNFAPYLSFGYTEWSLTTSAQDFDVEIVNDKGVGGDWAFDFYFGHLNVGDKIWIDDVKIEEIADPVSGKMTDGNICNGDFETDVANSGDALIAGGWRTYLVAPAVTNFQIDNASPISGLRSFKATCNAVGTDGWNSQLIWNFSPVVGQLYSLEFKAKASANVDIIVESIDDWPDRNNSMAYLTYNLTTAVQTFTQDIPTAVTEYDNYTLIFWLGFAKLHQSIWIDDVKLHLTNTNTGVKMLYNEDNNIILKTLKNAISINTDKNAEVSIFNMKGQIVSKKQLAVGEEVIPCSNGIYVVQITNGTQILKSTKLIVQ